MWVPVTQDLAPKVTFDERPERLEEKLLMLSTQYMKFLGAKLLHLGAAFALGMPRFRLHEQITTDTAASEKQMQKLMQLGGRIGDAAFDLRSQT